MKTRCYNPKYDSYCNYGGRGISICDEWLDKKIGFVNFYKWSIENGYEEHLTIDRVNNDGDYEPSNCRWISKHDQSYNRRTNVVIDINGVKKTINEWSVESGIDRRTIAWRFKNGKENDNLLSCVTSANMMSGIKGITWHKKGYWQVNYKENGLKKSKSFKELERAKDFLKEVNLNE